MSHDPFLPGQIVDPIRINGLDGQGTYRPELVSTASFPNLGSAGEAVGVFWKSGHWIEGFARFAFLGTGTSPGSGVFLITVPFPPDLSLIDVTTVGTGSAIVGQGWLRDNSTPANSNLVSVQFRIDAGVARLHMRDQFDNTAVNEADPFSWGPSDRIAVNFAYPAAIM